MKETGKAERACINPTEAEQGSVAQTFVQTDFRIGKYCRRGGALTTHDDCSSSLTTLLHEPHWHHLTGFA